MVWPVKKSSGRDLYIIAADQVSVVKIGRANSPVSRLKDLQASSPVRLNILRSFPGLGELEQYLHQSFDRQRLHGEWFSLHGELLRFVEESSKIPRNPTKGHVVACVNAATHGTYYHGNEEDFDSPETKLLRAIFGFGHQGRPSGSSGRTTMAMRLPGGLIDHFRRVEHLKRPVDKWRAFELWAEKVKAKS